MCASRFRMRLVKVLFDLKALVVAKPTVIANKSRFDSDHLPGNDPLTRQRLAQMPIASLRVSVRHLFMSQYPVTTHVIMPSSTPSLPQ